MGNLASKGNNVEKCLSRRPSSRFVYRLLLYTAIGILLPGCGVPGPRKPDGTFNLDFSRIDAKEANGAVVFFVDGVNPFIFEEMLQAGELPAIQTFFVDRGLFVPRAVCNIPSVTLANETSLVTGLHPGHHGITGINWFDRNQLIWRDYETIAQKNTLDGDYAAPTVYERFPDRTTFSMFFQAHRGVTKFIENWTSAGPPFFFGWYEFVDRLTLSRFDILIDVAEKRREFPAITVAYLLAPDFRAYDSGVESRQYREALRHTDLQIGRVLEDLKNAGLLDKLHIAFVSDHSLTEVTRHFHLAEFLRRDVGLNVASERLWENASFRTRLNVYQRYAAVLCGSGDRYWAVYLRRPIREADRITGFEPWPIRPDAADLGDYPSGTGTVDLPSRLAAQEAVDAVAYSVGPNAVRVARKTGQVEFRQDSGQGGPVRYEVVSGTDPLGWTSKVPPNMLDGSPHPVRAWLDATIDTDFPGLPAQIVAYFRARRAGDLAVFAAPGWDFYVRNRAGHGGLRPEDMCVPMLLAGPGVPHTRIRAAQTVDLVPTLLQLLNRPIPPDLDGKPLVEVPLRKAEG
ncbi:MAG: alkaline phosphatase family protein [Phycisphaerae bacterium]|nr:alkaline phosphatase family protein [Phycisphaerae bacterium]